MQLALQQERACELKKKVDAAKRRSAELRAEYQRSEKRLLEILTNHRKLYLINSLESLSTSFIILRRNSIDEGAHQGVTDSFASSGTGQYIWLSFLKKYQIFH